MSTNFSSLDLLTGVPLFSSETTSKSQISEIMERASAAAVAWKRLPVQERIDVARRFGGHLSEHRAEIADLISREVGKLAWDAAGEVSAAIAKVELSISALAKRRSDHEIESDGAAVTRHVRYQPIGVALVLGPFNFPLHLPGGQIIPALLAGNSVVFKPSEQATAVGDWMVNAWRSVGLPDDVLQIIIGGVDTAIAAIDSHHVNAIFMTGSRTAGRAIHRQLAGRPEVLLALELGGNNPVVVAEPVDPKQAATVLSFSAFVSSGQRCTCARRAIFIEGDSAERTIAELVNESKCLRVGVLGDDPPPHLGPLISAAAADSLRATYERLIDLRCKPLIPWNVDSRFASLVRPTLLDASEISDDAKTQIGELEWFGPMLVIDRVRDFESAIELASRTPYGLAASLLGGTRAMFDRFADDVGAGVVNWNGPTTGAAGAMPFGGLGDSGNHRAAGFYAIDFCSDPVASLQRATLALDDPWSIVK